ncbi:MarR family transcriptional regulator [Lactobacillus sp. YT155]|uniref:MarR family winged helix-turn-helix transcriptional regulator n=1 Tax=Lactobacillus sp. YT155 TaxID=3060955 RepID=UPI0026601BA2|nr:MarR family transcriptional regulator [Lactobacillus sp. YT155]MDO1604703.1 MarR family transcriptional regulator [Lactobacillus sp. YT155]
MNNELINEYKDDRTKELRGIFSSFSILQNRLQTIFDKTDTKITSKQFLLLTMIRYSKTALSYTELGKQIGTSRQNVKKLAILLEKNGFVKIDTASSKGNKVSINITEYAEEYFNKVYDEHTEILEKIFADYSNEEIDMFYQLMTKLYSGVEKVEEGLTGQTGTTIRKS